MTDSSHSPRSLKWHALAVFVLVLGLYHVNDRALPGGDTTPNRYLPFALLCAGDVTFNAIPLGRVQPNGQMQRPYFLVPGHDGRLYSTFGVAPGVMATPLVAAASLVSRTFSYERILRLGKWNASLFVAVAAALLFLACASWVGVGGAWVLALTWGLGTSAWSLISQALWQHSAAAPWLAAALLCLVRGRDRDRWIPWTGLFLGLATLCRTTNALLALPLAMYVFLHHRKSWWRFALLASLPAIALFAYNLLAFGHPLRFGQTIVSAQLAQWKTGVASPWVQSPGAFLTGLTGLLVSPSRGIFVYSPVLLFGLAGLLLSWRKGGSSLLRWCSVGFAGVILVHALWYDWWGGWSYGYRLPFDAVLLLVLGMAPLWPRIRQVPWQRWAFAVALLFSVTLQGLGAFGYDMVRWNSRPNVDRHPQRLWSLRDSQWLVYLRDPRWVQTLPIQDAPRLTLTICPIRVQRPPR